MEFGVIVSALRTDCIENARQFQPCVFLVLHVSIRNGDRKKVLFDTFMYERTATFRYGNLAPLPKGRDALSKHAGGMFVAKAGSNL